MVSKEITFITLNCRGLINKARNLAVIIDSLKPDVIIGTESWLYEDFKDGEVFPPGYTIYRKDRNRFGGRVFIAVMSHHISYELHEVDTNCEVIWIEMELSSAKNLFIASFCRLPNSSSEVLVELNRSLGLLSQRPGQHTS